MTDLKPDDPEELADLGAVNALTRELAALDERRRALLAELARLARRLQARAEAEGWAPE